ncbi:manganese/iron transporter [Caballeronia pedi]|uniref:Manganese/iron transporter n=1 Tax=Caballeronia pedi TaxID=1777141 RepID=A0A158E348_9BURK|nr:manganese/iron transporter [Caballeronia pedi]
MGMLLQWVASRVGVVTGRDLAQLCRERFSRRTTLGLWVACEIAIIACDVAEVGGSAVALQMLLGISLTAGVLCSAVGTFVMLALQSRGRRPRAATSGVQDSRQRPHEADICSKAHQRNDCKWKLQTQHDLR